jgi:hypothetical protein
MDKETITFFKALCGKIKEIAVLCEAYLEHEGRKNKQEPQPEPKNSEHPGNRLIPLTKWPEYHNWPSISSFRWMIFSSHQTRADYFIRRTGRRILISEKAFFEW